MFYSHTFFSSISPNPFLIPSIPWWLSLSFLLFPLFPLSYNVSHLLSPFPHCVSSFVYISFSVTLFPSTNLSTLTSLYIVLFGSLLTPLLFNPWLLLLHFFLLFQVCLCPHSSILSKIFLHFSNPLFSPHCSAASVSYFASSSSLLLPQLLPHLFSLLNTFLFPTSSYHYVSPPLLLQQWAIVTLTSLPLLWQVSFVPCGPIHQPEW